MDITPIEIPCHDGFRLSGTLYHPSQPRAAIMIAPATGIKKSFYHAFAHHLAEHGYAALTFDNRGIGASKDTTTQNSQASLVCWGRLDMTAALQQLKELYPDTTYHLVGHSAGGQLIGLMENAQDLSSIFTYGCSSGSLRHMRYPFKATALFWMNCFIPASNLIFGHTKSQWFGMGEPLPKTVAAQWRKWCNSEGYIEMELGKSIHKHLYDKINAPTLWLHASDDEIANHTTVHDMLRIYSQLEPEVVTLDPKSLGYKSLGHMSFFSRNKSQLWHYALDWLGKQETSQAKTIEQ